MDIKEHTTPKKLERYAFLWSLLRMVIAALSLFLGGMPIYYKVVSSSSGGGLLTLAWIISGVAAFYLGYLWLQNGKKVFGGDQKITIFFLIMVVTGINLGWTGIAGNNVGMNLVGYGGVADLILKATAIVYLFVAYTLWNAWNTNGEKLFVSSSTGSTAPKQEESTPVAEPEPTESRMPDESIAETDSDES